MLLMIKTYLFGFIIIQERCNDTIAKKICGLLCYPSPRRCQLQTSDINTA